MSLNEKKEEVLDIGQEVLGEFGFGGEVRPVLAWCNWGLSFGVEVDGKLAGVYFLKEGPCRRRTGTTIKGSGVEGIGLMVKEEFKGQGLGKLMMDHVSTLGFDYIWGWQDRRLNNLHHWLKRRKLVREVSMGFLTIQKF